MSMKKDLGSKLSEGVRQVKSQREQASAAAPPVPEKTTPVAKPDAPSRSASVAAEPAAPRVTTQTKTNLNKLHPKRVWPD